MTGHVKIEYRGPNDASVWIDGQEVPGLVSVHVGQVGENAWPVVTLRVEPATLDYAGEGMGIQVAPPAEVTDARLDAMRRAHDAHAAYMAALDQVEALS